MFAIKRINELSGQVDIYFGYSHLYQETGISKYHFRKNNFDDSIWKYSYLDDQELIKHRQTQFRKTWLSGCCENCNKEYKIKKYRKDISCFCSVSCRIEHKRKFHKGLLQVDGENVLCHGCLVYKPEKQYSKDLSKDYRNFTLRICKECEKQKPCTEPTGVEAILKIRLKKQSLLANKEI